MADTFKFLSLDEFSRLSPTDKQTYLEKLQRYVEAAKHAAEPPPAPSAPDKRT